MAITQNEAKVHEAFANQVEYCLANGAPITGNVVRAIIAILTRETIFGSRILDWDGPPLADALPIRCAAGFHALYLAGKAPMLAPIYSGRQMVPNEVEAIINNVLGQYEDDLLPWLDGPPQTNEIGRSANYIAALFWLSGRGLPPRFELNEIGSSAGLNLMIDRYHYELDGHKFGPVDSPVKLCPEWRGTALVPNKVEFGQISGCDIGPVDLSDPAQANRLMAYIWPEHKIRFERMRNAIKLVEQKKPNLSQGDAATWIDAQLAAPQNDGETRVIMHSIVWQYLGEERQAQITRTIETAGKNATAERPLAWVAVEANHTNYRHELIVKYWNGGPEDGVAHQLGTSHAHGAWIKWMA